MPLIHTDRVNSARHGVKVGLELGYFEPQGVIQQARGKFIFDLRDVKTGEVLAYWEQLEQKESFYVD